MLAFLASSWAFERWDAEIAALTWLGVVVATVALAVVLFALPALLLEIHGKLESIDRRLKYVNPNTRTPLDR